MSTIDDRLRALASRTLTAERPNLAAALAAVRGERSPRAAWELLVSRGLLPTSFLTDVHRRFRIFKALDELAPDEIEPLAAQWHGSPVRAIRFAPKPAFAAALAADVAGALAAEALALDAAAALWPWCETGKPPPSRVVWQSSTRESLLSSAAPFNLGGALAAHDAARAAGGEDWTAEQRDGWAPTVGVSTVLMERAAPFVLGARAWRRAVDADARVPGSLSSGLLGGLAYAAPAGVRGERFTTLRDPFAPLIALWERGYLLMSFGSDAALLAMSAR